MSYGTGNCSIYNQPLQKPSGTLFNPVITNFLKETQTEAQKYAGEHEFPETEERKTIYVVNRYDVFSPYHPFFYRPVYAYHRPIVVSPVYAPVYAPVFVAPTRAPVYGNSKSSDKAALGIFFALAGAVAAVFWAKTQADIDAVKDMKRDLKDFERTQLDKDKLESEIGGECADITNLKRVVDLKSELLSEVKKNAYVQRALLIATVVGAALGLVGLIFEAAALVPVGGVIVGVALTLIVCNKVYSSIRDVPAKMAKKIDVLADTLLKQTSRSTVHAVPRKYTYNPEAVYSQNSGGLAVV